jgi:hypothetical protein
MKNWEYCVWPNTEERIGCKPNHIVDIQKSVKAFVARHPGLFDGEMVPPHGLHRVIYELRRNNKVENWYLYCYAMTKYKTVDIVDAAPFQSCLRGERWLELVELHFKVFGMPWRNREYALTPALMISVGRDAVENLKKRVENFLGDIPVPHASLTPFRARLFEAETKIDEFYHESTTREDKRPATYALDHAVYILHNLIYDMGEAMRFVRKNSTKSDGKIERSHKKE